MDKIRHDDEGNLLPLMLSELIEIAKKTLEEVGDVPCWLEVDYTCGDYGEHNCKEGGPVMFLDVMNRDKLEQGKSYWAGEFDKAFNISSST